jgi:hypothetical protein
VSGPFGCFAPNEIFLILVHVHRSQRLLGVSPPNPLNRQIETLLIQLAKLLAESLMGTTAEASQIRVSIQSAI